MKKKTDIIKRVNCVLKNNYLVYLREKSYCWRNPHFDMPENMLLLETSSS